MTHRVFNKHKAKSITQIYSDVMKTIQCAHPPHHHNGFVATCRLWTASGGVYIYIYIHTYIQYNYTYVYLCITDTIIYVLSYAYYYIFCMYTYFFLETETLMSNCFNEVKPSQAWNAFNIRLIFGV